MKPWICILVAIGVLFTALPAWATSESQTAFYNDCITKRIINCHKKAAMLGSKSPCVRDCAKINAQQAKFLQENRAKLVHEMLKKNVKMKAYAVDYYLIKSFFGSVDYQASLD